MALTFRHAIGSYPGNSGPLSDDQGDQNTYTLDQRIAALETSIPTLAARGISDIALVGDQLTITYSDTTTQTFTLASAQPVWRGDWAPSTLYSTNNTFGINSAVYTVLRDHTSGLTFDPAATDGLGHDLYSKEFDIPSGALPTGGNPGNPLVKLTSGNYDVIWAVWTMPGGGNPGQALMKNTNVSGDWSWQDLSGGSLTLENLSDVSAGAVDLDILQFQVSGSTGVWTPISLSGLLDLDSLIDVTISSPVVQQTLRYSGAQWVNQQLDLADLTGACTPQQARLSTRTFLSPTSGTITIDPTLGDVFQLNISGDCTILLSGFASPGAHIFLHIIQNSTTNYTVTFANDFFHVDPVNTGTYSNQRIRLAFVSDGVSIYETSRELDHIGFNALPASTGSVSMDLRFNPDGVYAVVPTGDITLTPANSLGPGKMYTLIITTSGSTSRTITFSTGFKTQGTLVTGTASGKSFVIRFIDDGAGTLYEVSRTTALS